MATVYLAQDLRHGRKVAIKVLSPEFGSALGSDRFLREIRIAAELVHPHVVPLIGLGNREAALDWTERAWQERRGWLVYLRVNPPSTPYLSCDFRSPLPYYFRRLIRA